MSGSRNLRADAGAVVDDVAFHGRSLTDALAERLSNWSGADRGLLTELGYGTVRWYPALEAMLEQLVRKSLPKNAHQVHATLLVGLYQIWKTRVPDHAAVSETVAAAAALQKGKFRGLANAVLRRFLRERATIERAALKTDVARLAHPLWLLERLRNDWPGHWQKIAEENNRAAPMWLRINRRGDDDAALTRRRDALAKELQADICDGLPEALRLHAPTATERLPAIAAGDLSVQDGAAQLAAHCVAAEPGMRVLDACAAPGNKTAHLLERAGGELDLVALDIDERRCRVLKSNLERVGFAAQVITADAAATESWWDGRLFDRILLDAPCSATGVIRRHPDIKLLRRSTDIKPLASLQSRMLGALWPLLAPGGRLLYATCSVLADENQQQIRAFLATHSDAKTVELLLPDNIRALMKSGTPGAQLLPGVEGFDGFYFASMEKRAT